MAQQVSKSFGWEIKTDVLIRTRYTKPQVKLKEKNRKENIKNVFKSLNTKGLENKIVILVDDIVTTGSTMQEAARVLKEVGIKKVWGLALARG